MKITEKLRSLAATRRFTTLTLAAAACAGMLTGCASTDTAGSKAVFKFTVFHYKEPVQVVSWDYDAARNDGPECAALNVATLITHGDVDQWLSRWSPSERPSLTAEERAALQQKWQPLKDAHLAILDTVVSGATTVLEFSVETKDHQIQKLQVPLMHADNQWELTSVDPASDFLNWETSDNKIVAEVEGARLFSFLHQAVKTSPQAKL